MGNHKHYLLISLAVILLVAGSVPAAQPAQAATCAYYHYVSYGESLSSIGAAYGVPWKNIAAANGITSPYTIYPFQKLCISFRSDHPKYWRDICLYRLELPGYPGQPGHVCHDPNQ
jgi:LysM repeat protein